MEVTTVSPSPASPTEGDDLCETDVTTVATHSVTMLICLCGLAGNGAVIGLLSVDDDTIIIHSMAVIDFLLLLLTVPSALLLLVEDVSCSPILPLLYLRFLFRLSVVSCYLVPILITNEGLAQYVDHLFGNCRGCYIPDELIWVVMIVQFWVFSAVFSEIPTLTFLCASNEQEQCQAALITMWAIILLLYVVPMTVLVILQAVDLIKAKCGSQQEETQGPRIVIISIGLLSLLFILCNFLQQLGYIVVPSHFFFLLTCIHSSIKPFIYFLAGGCWRSCSVRSIRRSLQRALDEPEDSDSEPEDNDADSDDSAMDTRL